MKHLFKCLIIIGVILSHSLLWAQSSPPQVLHFSTAGNPPVSDIYRLVIQEAFRRIGIVTHVEPLPAERSLQLANQGINDGECCRIPGIEQLYSNLIPVLEEIYQIRFTAFSHLPPFPTTSWESLNPYDIGIVRGWKLLETHIKGTRSLLKFDTDELLFTHLKKKRIDIAVLSYLGGLALIKQLEIENVNLLHPPLAIRSNLLYFHKKHQALIPKVTAIFKEMKQDGTHQQILDEVIQPFLSKEQ